MKDCIFCKIVKGEISSKIAYEDKDIVSFHDISPSAKVHILIIPKKHIPTFTNITKNDLPILDKMCRVAQKLIKEKKIEKKYKLVINGGSSQFVPHLHLHLLGGGLTKEV